MDYNRGNMRDSTDPRARLRLVLTTIILFTIPCYCVGGIALMLAPSADDLRTPTPTVTETGTPTATFTPTITAVTASIADGHRAGSWR
jgi:hypothetical protein